MNTKKDFFIKFGMAESFWENGTCETEILLFGVDSSEEGICLRVRGHRATCRFCLKDEYDTPENVDALGNWLKSNAFKEWLLFKMGDRAKTRDGKHAMEVDDVVTAVERETIKRADKPTKATKQSWKVSSPIVATFSSFAYGDKKGLRDAPPIPDFSPRPEAGPGAVRVMSCVRTQALFLQEFYRVRDVRPFTWWTAADTGAPRYNKSVFAKEYTCFDRNITTSKKYTRKYPTSMFVFDIEAVKDYLEPWEDGFSEAAEKERIKCRKQYDVDHKENEGILNSYVDQRVCNIHVLFWKDWDSKGKEPDRSICLVLDKWEGLFPSFKKGPISSMRRDDLFSTPTEIKHFNREATLLSSFYDIVRDLDPDIISGWNIFGYDLWIIEARSRRVGLTENCFAFSRLRDRPCKCVTMSFQTAGKGSFKGKKELKIPGRVVLDGMYAIQKDLSARLPLTSFSLNSAAEHYLGTSLGEHAAKDDLPYSRMRQEFSTPEGRERFCKYCLKDTYLTALVLQEMGIVSLYEALCNTVGIEMHAVIFKGETERTLPNLRRRYESQHPILAMEDPCTKDYAEQQEVTGGLVHKPHEGLYDET